ncbi:MAG: polysaccharide biosynthesis C-terminal domain-containing protein, partial [Waterburya sp.]
QGITSVQTVTLGTILIARYQLIGAAVTSIISLITAFGMYSHFIQKGLYQYRLWITFRRPLLVSIVMFCLFKMLQQTTENIWVILAISTCFYSVVAGGFLLHALGGPSVVLSKLQKSK